MVSTNPDGLPIVLVEKQGLLEEMRVIFRSNMLIEDLHQRTVYNRLFRIHTHLADYSQYI